MNVVVCATRQPFALDEIRKLGRVGHRVIALDSFEAAPGSHSRHVSRRVTTKAPRFDTPGFIADVKRVVGEESVDLVLPTFEEVFYLARHLDELPCEVFTSPFDMLLRLHHKGDLNALARELGIRVPETTVVQSREELTRAIASHPRYIARAVYSRGGTKLLTNVGPLAGLVAVEDCAPTPEVPWIVQEWIDGDDLCTFSLARHGRVTAHVSYIHPLELEHSGGIVIESIHAADSLEPVRRIVEALGYHGQISFDFKRAPTGDLVMLECNPRACNGVSLMTESMFARALTATPDGAPPIVESGRRRMISLAVVRDLLKNRQHARQALGYLFSPKVRDIFGDPKDPLPALYQFFTYGQIRRYRRWAGHDRDRRTDLIEAFSYDFAYNGEPLP